MPITDMNREILKTVITESQRCQRNWDLSRRIPDDDIEVLKTAVAQAPSKQNRVYYRPIFITDRAAIEHIHQTTECFTINWDPYESTTNAQVLANLLVVFVRDRNVGPEGIRTGIEYGLGEDPGKDVNANSWALLDENRALGIAMGYLIMSAHLMGYCTGIYNAKHNPQLLFEMFGSEVLLACGVGYHDENRDRREHHLNPDYLYPSFDKDVIVEDGDIYTDRILGVDLTDT